MLSKQDQLRSQNNSFAVFLLTGMTTWAAASAEPVQAAVAATKGAPRTDPAAVIDLEASTQSTVEIESPDHQYNYSTRGMFLLWEGTTTSLPHSGVALTLQHVDFGLFDDVQVGVQPVQFIFRTPNAQLKVRVIRDDTWGLAFQTGLYALLPGATESMLSSSYATRLSIPDETLYVVPMAAMGSFQPLDWLRFTATTSALLVAGSSPIQTRVTPGLFLTAEMVGESGHGLSFHAGRAGLTTNEMTIIGWSYRYGWSWGEIRAGYAWQLTPDGSQGLPLFNAGLVL